MPQITSSLSRYTSPSYSIDFFTNKREGKSSSSKILTSHYNKLASSIVATQTRLLPLINDPATVDTEVNLYFYSLDKVNMTKREIGGEVQSWQSDSNPEGQNGISDGIIDDSLYTGTSVGSEFFYGQQPIQFRDYNYYRIGFRDNVSSPGSLAGPVFVGNRPIPAEYPLVDYLQPNSTYQVISQVSSAISLSAKSMMFTPYHSTILKNGVNVDNTTVYDPLKDRQMVWNSQDVNLDSSYHAVETQRCRVIIGSSRGVSIGTQYRPNKTVYNPLQTLTGSVTSVPSGFSPDGKNLLGTGALFLNGTFYIPIPEQVNLPVHYSSYSESNKSWMQNKFFCYPGFNCPVGHAIHSSSYSGLIAHVLVLGLK
jgi:hypothetical protein